MMSVSFYFFSMLTTMVAFVAANPGYEAMPADMNLLSHIVIGAEPTCGGRVLRRNGYVFSHKAAFERTIAGEDLTNKLHHYPDDINCTLNVCSGLNSRLLLQFPRPIRLACSSDKATCDCIHIYDGPTIASPLLKSYCRNYELDELEPIESKGTDLTFHFTTDSNCRNEEGFHIQFSAFRRPPGKQPHIPAIEFAGLPGPGHTADPQDNTICDEGEEFLCDTDRCIPNVFKCDQIEQCLDNTDEGDTGCSADQQLCAAVLELQPYFGYILAIIVLTVFILVLLLSGFCYLNRDVCTSCDVIGCCGALCAGGGDNTVHVQSVQPPSQKMPQFIGSGMTSSVLPSYASVTAAPAVHAQHPIYVPEVTPIVQPQLPIYAQEVEQPMYAPEVEQPIYAPEVGHQLYATEVRPAANRLRTSLTSAVHPRQSFPEPGVPPVVQPQSTLYASSIKGTVRSQPSFFAQQPYDGQGAVERQN